MDIIRQQEERYLQMLRRVALGLAKLLLVFVVLALLSAACAGAEGAYHWWDGSRSHLPSQTERLQTVNPCPYFTNGAKDSNGRDSRGAIPVKRLLRSCDVTEIPDAKFTDLSSAITASQNDVVAIVKEAFNRQYNDEVAARATITNELTEAAQSAASPVRESDLYSDAQKDALDLDVSTAIAAYFTMARRVLLPQQLTASDGNAVEHALDLRFVTNQIRVDLQTAVKKRMDALEEMALAFASAAGWLSYAAQLFAAFLALMFLFLFIKYELHLRDINNSLSSTSNHA